MDFEYGCSTVNKYAFLDENEVEDPSDLLAQVAKANEATTKKDAKKTDSKGKKVDAKKGKDAKKPLQSTDNAVKKSDNKDGKKFGQGKPEGDLAKENRGPKKDFQGDRPPRQQGDRPPRQQGDRPPRQQGDRPPRRPRTDADGNVVESAEGGEGFRGGFRGPRGAGGYRGGDRNNYHRGQRREEGEGEGRKFDRHSGSEKTGIKAVDKKDGAGKGNWGTATDEVVIEQTMGEGVEGQETNKDWAERVDENEEKKGEEVPEEETPNFMTLEEYKALKSQINKRNDFNIRRPGEGEDQSKWGKTYVLPKKVDDEDEEEEETDEEEEEDDEPEDTQKKELIKSMQSAFKFESNTGSDRGGRGDRGRGDRGRGGDRRGDRRDFQKKEGEGEAPAESTGDAPVAEQQPKREDRRPQGGRGGRGGAGGRGGRSGPMKSAPKFDDEKDFPTLGK